MKVRKIIMMLLFMMLLFCISYENIRAADVESMTESANEGINVQNESEKADAVKAPRSLSSYHLFISANKLSEAESCAYDSSHGLSWAKTADNYIPLGSKMTLCWDNIAISSGTSTMYATITDANGVVHTSDSYTITSGTTYYGYFSITPSVSKASGQYTGTLHVGSDSRSVSWYATDTELSVTSNPANKTITAMDTASFSVTASGSNLSYQWYYNTTNSTSGGTAIAGATSSTYRIVNVPYSYNGRYYYCKISNYSSSSSYAKVTKTSDTAKLTVNKASMTHYISGYEGVYDGLPHEIRLSVSGSDSYTVYYSTSNTLTSSNYRSVGSTVKPTRQNAGTTRVYVYIHDNTGNYYDVMDTSSITIEKAEPGLLFENTALTKTYGDSPFLNTIAATTDGTVTYTSTNTKVAQVDGSTGVVTIVGAGTAVIEANAAEGTNYRAGKASYILNVNKAVQKIIVSFHANGGSCSTTSKSVTCGSTYGTLPTPARTGYTFAGWYTSATGGSQVTSNTTVSITGNQTLYAHWTSVEEPSPEPETPAENPQQDHTNNGNKNVTEMTEAELKALAKQNNAKVVQSDTISLKSGTGVSVADCYIALGKIKPGKKKFTLRLVTNGVKNISYKSSSKKVAAISTKGTVKLKSVGKTTITVTATVSSTGKKITKKYTLTVKPDKTSIKYVKSTGKGKLEISWKQNISGNGYQICCGLSKKFTKNAKSFNVSGNKNTLATIKELIPKAKYYVRVRSFKTISGKTYFGAWSKTKSVKVK